jgi:hypothetical protein
MMMSKNSMSPAMQYAQFAIHAGLGGTSILDAEILVTEGWRRRRAEGVQ